MSVNKKHKKSLAEHFGLKKVNFKEVNQSKFAHCIIDVQRQFCDPKYSERRGNRETAKVSKRIASVADDFREANIPTYIVYYTQDKKEGPDKAGGGLYKVKMKKGDIAVPKNDDSAFKGSDISKRLKEAGIKTILVSGFNTNSCVRRTVTDALDEGFNVWLLEDCVENDEYNPGSGEKYKTEMMHKGALRKMHKTALKQVKEQTANDNMGKDSICKAPIKPRKLKP